MVKENIFKQFAEKRRRLIRDGSVLQSSYSPSDLPHREEQIREMADHLNSALDGSRPSNIVCMGKTGTGKTATVRFIGDQLRDMDPQGSICQFFYVNCVICDSPYAIIIDIADSVIKDDSKRIPYTGLSLDRVVADLTDYMDSIPRAYVVALDEIDMAASKNGNGILYHLLSMNDRMERSSISVIGITNSTKFLDGLDPKVMSRLAPVKMVFPPYGPSELSDILSARAAVAFDESVLEDGVIPYIAAVTSKNGGDARVAIDMLRKSADLAERNGDAHITEAHVRKAKNVMEMDAVSEVIRTLNLQSKIVLMSALRNSDEGTVLMTTGDVYTKYVFICDVIGATPVTQRRVGDLISELDSLGLVYARTKSYGRNGRTKEIELSVPRSNLDILIEDPMFSELKDYRSPKQTTII